MTIAEVTLTGITDCDLCTDHYVWDCPMCGQHHDHYQVVLEPEEMLDVTCACGVTMRITREETHRWQDRFGLHLPSSGSE